MANNNTTLRVPFVHSRIRPSHVERAVVEAEEERQKEVLQDGQQALDLVMDKILGTEDPLEPHLPKVARPFPEKRKFNKKILFHVLNRKVKDEEFFYDWFSYTLFIAAFLIAVFIGRGPPREFSEMERGITAALLLSTSDSFDKTYYDIQQIDDIWDWLVGPFAENLFPPQWYNGENYTWKEAGYVALNNKLIGAIRLRQLRVRSEDCTLRGKHRFMDPQCYPEYSEEKRSTDSFGPGNKYTWSGESAANTVSWQSSHTQIMYDATGFIVDIDPNNDTFVATVEELRKDLWLDRQSRALFINVNVINSNILAYGSVQLLFEFSAGGSVSNGDAHISMFVATLYSSAKQIFGAVMEVCVVVFVCYYIIRFVRELVWSKKWRGSVLLFFYKLWNIVDLVALSLFVVIIVVRLLYIGSSLRIELANGSDITTDNYIPLEKLAVWNETFDQVIAVNIFFAFLKAFKYLDLYPRMSLLWKVIARALPDLISFMVIFFIIFLCFALMGVVIFGSQVEDYSSLSKAMITLGQMMFGNFDLSQLTAIQPKFAVFFFFLFMVVVTFILINMFLAILNDSYNIVQQELEHSNLRKRIKAFLVDKLFSLKWWRTTLHRVFTCCCKRATTTSVQSLAEEPKKHDISARTALSFLERYAFSNDSPELSYEELQCAFGEHAEAELPWVIELYDEFLRRREAHLQEKKALMMMGELPEDTVTEATEPQSLQNTTDGEVAAKLAALESKIDRLAAALEKLTAALPQTKEPYSNAEVHHRAPLHPRREPELVGKTVLQGIY